MSEKIYVPKCSAKETQFPDGGKLLKIGFHADTLAEFVRNHANDRGYVNFVVTRRKEVGQHGETHSVSLDTWQPGRQSSGRRQDAPAGEQTAAQKALAARRASTPPATAPPEDDDVPF